MPRTRDKEEAGKIFGTIFRDNIHGSVRVSNSELKWVVFMKASAQSEMQQSERNIFSLAVYFTDVVSMGVSLFVCMSGNVDK